MKVWQNFTGKIFKSQNLAGGDINEVKYLQTEKGEFVLKTNTQVPDNFFEAEAKNLWLLEKNGLKVPEIIAFGKDFLLLKYYPEGSRNYILAGQRLALLHKIPQEQVGLSYDNFIGLLVQKNTWEKSWVHFYLEYRIKALLKMLGIFEKDHAESKLWEKFILRMYEVLQEPPFISLLHGDLWGGNLYHSKDGPLFIDPACYYGDHLVDLAMTELFGGFSQSFYDAYEEILAFRYRFGELKRIYQLYPILVHAKLFGSSYYYSAREIARHYV